MTPEVGEHLDKARECLLRAKIILGAKNEAGLREFSRFLSQAYNLKDIADMNWAPAPPCLSTARRPRSLWPSGSSIVLQKF